MVKIQYKCLVIQKETKIGYNKPKIAQIALDIFTWKYNKLYGCYHYVWYGPKSADSNNSKAEIILVLVKRSDRESIINILGVGGGQPILWA